MGDMGNGVDSYNRGAVLGETRSHQSVRFTVVKPSVQSVHMLHQPPALIPKNIERAGACLGAHSMASSMSPHSP